MSSVDRLMVDRTLLRLELEFDPLQGARREGERVGVGIADARERVAADVECRPGDEPACGTRNARDNEISEL